MSLPDYHFLPAPLWLITVLHLVTLTLHFAAMNLLVGGLIAVLWGKFTHRWEHPVVQQFVGLFPTAMAATVTLGVAPLLFLQLVFPRQVYAASIVSAWFWLGIVCAVIVAYYLLYAAALSQKQGRGRMALLLFALIATGYVSFVYSSVFSMVERPRLYAALYAANPSGLVLHPDVGDYLFRWLHMVSGAITVGGFFVGWLAQKNGEAYQVGRGFFIWGMVITSILGLGYLLTLGEALPKLMRTPAIWALTLGILLPLGSLHFFFKKKFAPAAVMLFVSIFSMVITRHYVRLLNLAAEFDPSSVPVRPQWSIFVVFLLFFVIALALLWYMLSIFYARRPLAQR